MNNYNFGNYDYEEALREAKLFREAFEAQEAHHNGSLSLDEFVEYVIFLGIDVSITVDCGFGYIDHPTVH